MFFLHICGIFMFFCFVYLIKKIVFDSVLNYTEWSRWFAEYSHRVIAYLDKFLMLLFHPYILIKYWFSKNVLKIGD